MEKKYPTSDSSFDAVEAWLSDKSFAYSHGYLLTFYQRLEGTIFKKVMNLLWEKYIQEKFDEKE